MDETSRSSGRTVEGGCFCGAVRFRAELTGDAAICHCEHCRRATGASMWACAEARRDEVEWTAGTPAAYHHASDWPTPITRRFCGDCGTTLTYERDGSECIDLSLAALDDPEVVAPRYHAYASRRLSWTRLNDGLPEYDTLPGSGEREAGTS